MVHWRELPGCTVFFRFNVNSRSVLILFGLIVLLIKEQVAVAYLRSRAASADCKEPVLIRRLV